MKTSRPGGEIRIIGKIDSSGIMRPEDSYDEYFSKYQKYYALALWALQEKFGLTYPEATFFCCEKFREGDKFEFVEKVFGMEYDEYWRWYDYLNSIISDNELSEYIGEFEPNLIEADVYQRF